jgi:hypothetical protein
MFENAGFSRSEIFALEPPPPHLFTSTKKRAKQKNRFSVKIFVTASPRGASCAATDFLLTFPNHG